MSISLTIHWFECHSILVKFILQLITKHMNRWIKGFLIMSGCVRHKSSTHGKRDLIYSVFLKIGNWNKQEFIWELIMVIFKAKAQHKKHYLFDR